MLAPSGRVGFALTFCKTMSSFCQHLQLPWTLRSLDAHSLDRVAIQVCFEVSIPGPPIIGRHGSDILSYPMVYSTVTEAEFVFKRCLSLTVREEMLVSISEKTPEGEGKTFVRLLSSPQIDAARLGRPDGFSVFHYRLNFQNEIIDVVCSKVPEVTVKNLREPDSQIAGE
jgi:hypothetical protein